MILSLFLMNSQSNAINLSSIQQKNADVLPQDFELSEDSLLQLETSRKLPGNQEKLYAMMQIAAAPSLPGGPAEDEGPTAIQMDTIGIPSKTNVLLQTAAREEDEPQSDDDDGEGYYGDVLKINIAKCQVEKEIGGKKKMVMPRKCAQ